MACELNLEQFLAKLKLEKDVKWLKYYSSKHKILLVGEGDFSFSLCLARAFGSASNITATSLDSYDELLRKHKDAKSNLASLKMLGETLFHRVDVGTMRFHYALSQSKFDRIIFNFPYAVFDGKENNHQQIKLHRMVVCDFFINARRMLLPAGEIHVNHKTSKWDINALARQNSLKLIECIDFDIQDYPGYRNRRGTGSLCGASFRLGRSCTFKYLL